jgi:hypothetical protein
VKLLRFAGGIAGVLAVSGLLVSVASATSCAPGLFRDGVLYLGGWRVNERQMPFGEQVGEALNPPCNDTGGMGRPGCAGDVVAERLGKAVPVFRLPGIDPEVAVGARHYGHDVYIATGYFAELPDHPLHMAIYGSPGLPNERRGGGWECGPPIPDLPGAVVSHTPGGGLLFQVRFDDDQALRHGGRTALYLDAQTRITGFDRNGLPHIMKGDRLRATVLECTASGGRWKVVADSISPP